MGPICGLGRGAPVVLMGTSPKIPQTSPVRFLQCPMVPEGKVVVALARWVLARSVNPLSVGLSFWFGRFDTWLSSRLKLPPSYLLSYLGNYTDDAQSWRMVDITRLTTKYQHDRADQHICTSLLKTKTCSLERALRRTHRFQKWLRAKRLTPDLVQVSAPP